MPNSSPDGRAEWQAGLTELAAAPNVVSKLSGLGTFLLRNHPAHVADIVREFLPDAQITFEHESGGKDTSGNYLIDNSRAKAEFEVEYPPYRQRVLEIINDVRRDEGLPLVSA